MNLEEIERGIMLITGENNKKQLFLHGGCYVYAKLIQQRYGGILYTNSTVDHVIIKLKNGKFYDYSGEYDKIPYVNDRWHPMKWKEEELAKKRFRIKWKLIEKEINLCQNTF